MTSARGDEICSRVAEINYQEVLVDTISTKKAEGLRYYLDKDPKTKSMLNIYQDRSKPAWQHAALGTLGSLLILGGVFQVGSENSQFFNRNTLFLTGGSLLIINYLIYNTVQQENEKLLGQAIIEYNRRNLPKIYFSPFQTGNSQSKKESPRLGVLGGITKGF